MRPSQVVVIRPKRLAFLLVDPKMHRFREVGRTDDNPSSRFTLQEVDLRVVAIASLTTKNRTDPVAVVCSYKNLNQSDCQQYPRSTNESSVQLLISGQI